MPPDEPSAPVREGDVLDAKYRVERLLGQGGMGIVVAARHMHLDQRVAIKFVLPEALGNAEAMERFAREARAAVKLRSEHVARVLDVGTMQNGAPYMVMEYLEGSDLGALIEVRGGLHPQEAVDYVLQACEAIAEAHANGIVHRDLKPRNLFVTTAVDGKPLVKVLDFGISKQFVAPGSQSDMSLTKTSAVMGSPNYMSPEQLRSAKLVDARTDIWALGVLLYETLTGRVPFEAETVTQLTAMVLQDAPRPIEELRKDLPGGLSRVIGKCLEKDPAKRYQSVADLARELEQYGTTRGIAQRIAQVNTLRSRAVAAESSASGRIAVTGGTSVAWGETELASTKKRGTVVAIAAGVATIALLAAGIAIGMRAMRGSPAAGAALDGVPTVRQIELAQPPPSSTALAAPPIPSALATAATALPSPSALATAAPTAIPAAHHHSTAAPPKPKPHGNEDLPNERN